MFLRLCKGMLVPGWVAGPHQYGHDVQARTNACVDGGGGMRVDMGLRKGDARVLRSDYFHVPGVAPGAQHHTQLQQ